jgi:UDP:flavonoid glycosyltransferase YjiC (YdhE family)
VHVTGYYFFSTASYQPPTALQTFLETGKPPVCITFGSMVNRDAERIDAVIHESLARTGNRGIILSGWSGVRSSSSGDLLYQDSAPHDWLLPRCRMVIHHGGAGTTASGLRAGIPNIVVPFMADQPFWGRRVHAMGAGPKPVPVRSLSVEKLARAIAVAEKESLRERAQMIGQNIRREDGIGETVKWIEKYSNNFRS